MGLKKIYTVIYSGYQVTLPGLAYAIIHRVFREGTTLEPVVNIPPDGSPTFAYDYSTGVFTFGTEGNGNPEIIEIVYLAGIDVPPDVPPGEVCEIPMGASVVVNDNYTVSVTMPTSGDYFVTISLAADGCGVDPIRSGNVSGGVTFTTVAFTDGDYVVCIRRRCGSDVNSGWLTIPFTVDTSIPPPPPEPNGKILNTHLDGQLQGLAPAFYSLASGSFPMPNGYSVRDIYHNGYTGKLLLSVLKITPFGGAYVKVRIDGIQVLCGPVVSGTNVLPSVSFTASQFFEIEYTSTPC